MRRAFADRFSVVESTVTKLVKPTHKASKKAIGSLADAIIEFQSPALLELPLASSDEQAGTHDQCDPDACRQVPFFRRNEIMLELTSSLAGQGTSG